MSGYEPGRPAIERREAQYIWIGTRVLSDSGVEWRVTGLRTEPEGTLTLFLSRDITEWQQDHEEWTVLGDQPIRCRVEKEDR